MHEVLSKKYTNPTKNIRSPHPYRTPGKGRVDTHDEVKIDYHREYQLRSHVPRIGGLHMHDMAAYHRR